MHSPLLLLLACMVTQDPPAESTSARRDRLLRTISARCADSKFAEALEPAEQLAALDKSDGRAAYGLACILARLGRTDDAFKQLDRAIKAHGVLVQALDHDADLTPLRSLPRFAKSLDAARRDAERYTHGGAGWEVRLPAHFDQWRPAPLIVALHGYGSDAADIQRLWSKPADDMGAVLLAPQGRFVGPDGNGRSWGVGGREAPARDIMAALNDTRRRIRIDPARIALTGFSQGGGLSYAIGLLYPKTFHALIPMAGPFTLSEDPQLKSKAISNMRVFIIVGEKDPNLAMNRQAAAAFSDAGAATRLNVFANIGHAPPPGSDAVLRDALRFVWEETTTTRPRS